MLARLGAEGDGDGDVDGDGNADGDGDVLWVGSFEVLRISADFGVFGIFWVSCFVMVPLDSICMSFSFAVFEPSYIDSRQYEISDRKSLLSDDVKRMDDDRFCAR